ncbi:MAG: S8 family serine peptidase [Hyphomicrobiales bacterium]
MKFIYNKSPWGVSNVFLFLFFVATIISCKKDENKAFVDDTSFVKGQYVVVLNQAKTKMSPAAFSDMTYKESQARVRPEIQKILDRAKVSADNLLHVYSSSVIGFSVKLTNDQYKYINNCHEVQSITKDIQVKVDDEVLEDTKKGILFGQHVPMGIKKVGGFRSGIGKRIWVIDSGVDLDHPDLNVDAKTGANFCILSEDKSPDDNLGHGTHVAGTIAAKDNNIGVVGVAAGATIIPIKVLNRDGDGQGSDFIKAIDYICQNSKPGDVVNISIIYGKYVPFEKAVERAAEKGILFAISAGNDHDDASKWSPQAVIHPNVYKVAAYNIWGTWASFSNYGECVNVVAPGTWVRSTYKKGKYKYMNGTSMASPHIAGLLALDGRLYPNKTMRCRFDNKNYPAIKH